MADETRIDTSIRQLSSKDGDIRQQARMSLVDIGQSAALPLTKLLTEKDKQTRWEAAKALVAIADLAAIPALIRAMNDDVFEVRWLVGEALVAVGTDSVTPVLETLITNSDKLFVREEAHHVFKYILRDNPEARELRIILEPVLDALEGSTPAVSTPGEAKIALEKMKY